MAGKYMAMDMIENNWNNIIGRKIKKKFLPENKNTHL